MGESFDNIEKHYAVTSHRVVCNGRIDYDGNSFVFTEFRAVTTPAASYLFVQPWGMLWPRSDGSLSTIWPCSTRFPKQVLIADASCLWNLNSETGGVHQRAK